jgi:membrane protein
VGPTWKDYPAIFRRSLLAAFENRTFSIAKAAAYSALLAFFPVLTSAAAILIQAKAGFVSKTISEFLFEVVPPGTDELVRYQFAVKGQRPVLLLIVAAVLAIWAASGLVGSLIQGFQETYRIRNGRPFLRNMALSMALVLLSSMPLLAACALLLFGGYIDRLVMKVLAIDPIFSPVASFWHVGTQIARFVVALAGLASVTTLLYYYGPNRRQRWSGVWRGAVLSTALWVVATEGFGWYVSHLANYNVVYGTVGTSIALLVWMYLMSLIALLGCGFNAEYERTAGRPSSF